ncbi:MAG: FHA domain-containing protein [bacterium]|nr:FHA domain-containing protein [bacterium]
MSPKSDKLAQNIQEIQKFVSQKSSTESDIFQPVIDELSLIADCLKQKKLILHLVSQDKSLVQELVTLILTDVSLSEFYELKTTSLSDLPEETLSQRTFLRLCEFIESLSRQNQISYQLESKCELSIGRNPSSEIALSQDIYSRVSWNHAEINCSIDTECKNNHLAWQICDRNSTNGTYVNGDRVNGCHILQSGDCITLGAPNFEEHIPQLIFESLISQEDRNYREVLDSDLICLVVSNATLSENEQWFVKQIAKNSFAKCFIVLAPSSDAADTENEIAAIEKKLQTLSCSSAFEISSFSAALSEDANAKDKKANSKCNFLDTLVALVKRNPEDILSQRLINKILKLMALIDIHYENQLVDIQKRIDREEDKLVSTATEDFKERLKRIIKKVNDDKEKFFRQIKTELSQSKASILDTYSKKSIFYNVQQFIDELKPCVVKKDGNKYIQISESNRIGNPDINLKLTRLTSVALAEWASTEWYQISNSYSEGGLNGLFQRTQDALDIIPALSDDSQFQPIQNIDIQKILVNSFVVLPYECLFHKETSIIGYILEQVRTNTMQLMFVMGLVAMVGGASGGQRQMMASIMAALRDAPWIFGFVVFVLINLLSYFHQKDNHQKIEEVSDKLKKDLRTHYQSLAKNLAEKIVQEFTLIVELEERHLRELIEVVSEKFASHIADTEKNQIQIKKYIEQHKNGQKLLDKEMADFQKLKRL